MLNIKNQLGVIITSKIAIIYYYTDTWARVSSPSDIIIDLGIISLKNIVVLDKLFQLMNLRLCMYTAKYKVVHRTFVITFQARSHSTYGFQNYF